MINYRIVSDELYDKYQDDLLKVSTPAIIARDYDIAITTVYRWIDEGYIVGRQVGGEHGQWFVSVDSVIAFRGETLAARFGKIKLPDT